MNNGILEKKQNLRVKGKVLLLAGLYGERRFRISEHFILQYLVIVWNFGKLFAIL